MISKAEVILTTPGVTPLEREILQKVVSGEANDSPTLSSLLVRRQIVISAALKSLYTKGLLYRRADRTKRRGYLYAIEPFDPDLPA